MVTIFYNDILNEFLYDPEKYETLDGEIEEYTDSESMINYLHFTFEFKDENEVLATGEMGGFYYKGIFYIHIFSVDPQGQGFGSLLIKYLSDKFIEYNINIEAIDIADESRNFWNKMEEQGLVLVGDYPEIRDYYGYDSNRKFRLQN